MGFSPVRKFPLFVHVQLVKILFFFDFKPTNVMTELMLTERTKMLSQERSKLASVQSLTDKMSRLTNRKLHNPKLLLNELTTSDKNVTFSNNNHSTSTTKATSSEGKNASATGHKSPLTHSMDWTMTTFTKTSH